MFTDKRRSGEAPASDDEISRMTVLIAGFALLFAVLTLRLVDLAIAPPGAHSEYAASGDRKPRPEIVDRNGVLLATDIIAPSLHADSRKVLDPDLALEKLQRVLPDIDRDSLLAKLNKRRGFVWIKRELTPRQQAEIHRLGIPGFIFTKERRRAYPNGRLAAHVLGAVDVDNKGRAGIEKYIDTANLAAGGADKRTDRGSDAPGRVRLTIDARVQHALTATLAGAMEEFSAKAAMGAIVDVRTGEVVAMASLPDYNPNEPSGALDPDKLNRMTGGVYEPGSTLKMVTVAMALDEGAATLETKFDARQPLRVGRQTINDFHAQRRILTLQEVFTYSSNIGAGKMAASVGIERHRAFIEKLGLLERPKTELPEAGATLAPREWKTINSMTIAFGHGISVAPMRVLAAGVALVNGGRLMPLTFLPRSEIAALTLSEQVVKPETSATMRKLMADNVENGTAGKAKVEGYAIGGKTGTAEKVVNGRYDSERRRTSFLGAFPIDDPEYALLLTLDEPQPTENTHGYATSGWNAVPTAGKVIARVAPILGLMPAHAQTTDPVIAETTGEPGRPPALAAAQ